MGRGSEPQPSDEPLDALELRPSRYKRMGSSAGKPGASLWLSEVRQENAFTQRAVYLAYQTDCQCCSLREQCLAKGAKDNRALPPSVRSVASCPHLPRLSVSKNLSFSDQYDGWMWQAKRFAAPGPLIGVVSIPRSSHVSRPLRRFFHHHVPLVKCVRITPGVGPTGSHGMSGGATATACYRGKRSLCSRHQVT